ncbi:DUF7344 domain-containing protein [Natrinema halophilum]|uniref:DUF7344 domain-containing protein n=1 Tax=Natrinema halophilum TaxID=1699371 RepID=A0A7D5K7X8_9EURY|nr:hypothetical protein [Natrinema halophilum]QLG50343.1 hypothetical protein HYG82_16575 [Natrinema halophilum]
MDKSDAFRVLASADRQYLFYELIERDGASTVETLSQQVAGRRHRTTPGNVTNAEIDRTRVRLAHIHLPKFLEQNIVDVDWADGSIAFTEDADIDLLLEAAAELEQWPPEPQREPLLVSRS